VLCKVNEIQLHPSKKVFLNVLFVRQDPALLQKPDYNQYYSTPAEKMKRWKEFVAKRRVKIKELKVVQKETKKNRRDYYRWLMIPKRPPGEKEEESESVPETPAPTKQTTSTPSAASSSQKSKSEGEKSAKPTETTSTEKSKPSAAKPTSKSSTKPPDAKSPEKKENKTQPSKDKKK